MFMSVIERYRCERLMFCSSPNANYQRPLGNSEYNSLYLQFDREFAATATTLVCSQFSGMRGLHFVYLR